MMSVAGVIARWSGRLLPLIAAVVLLDPAPAVAGEFKDGPIVRSESVELRFTAPYQAGKVPIVFIHGLFGSPGNWAVMIDQLSSDPAVHTQFQFLTFRYDSLRSVPESALRLREALDEARRRFDPEGNDSSFDRVVLVGHSLGGLVAKAACRAPDLQPLGSPHAPPGEGERRFAPRVGRVVFVATPHRGSPLDRGAVRSAGLWLARTGGASPKAGGAPVSSVAQLTWDNPFLTQLERARDSEWPPFHSIVAALGEPYAEGATDGLVPVASARLAGARSELVVRAHHVCLQHPEVIREVRRVLGEHAADPVPILGGRP